MDITFGCVTMEKCSNYEYEVGERNGDGDGDGNGDWVIIEGNGTITTVTTVESCGEVRLIYNCKFV